MLDRAEHLRRTLGVGICGERPSSLTRFSVGLSLATSWSSSRPSLISSSTCAGGAAPAWPTRVLITAMEEAQIIGTALIIRPSRALALPTDANASLGYAHASAVGGGRAISFASLRRFCAIAASMNSNRATPRSAQSQTTEPAEGHQTQAGTGARSRPRSPPGRSGAAAWLRTRHVRGIGRSLTGNDAIHALAVCLLGLQP